jgi:hypothetical protein
MSASGIAASPPVPGAVPPQVRHEGAAAVKGFRAALAFESMLLKQLLSEALPEAGGAGEAEGGGGEGTGLGSDPRLAGLPETVGEAVVEAGGLGLAGQLYHSFEASR